ncbi:MAG: hypothetical protein GY822_10045 [Deltaproteobacteria bacterium]|nr:hypothetical protein [Deltaproteobacteria bacterium]
MRRSQEDPNRIWRRQRHGRTVEVFLLDVRCERKPSSKGGDEIFLSPSQLGPLKGGLLNSPARFKCIVSTVPISIMPFVVEGADRWEGYPRLACAKTYLPSSKACSF